MISTERLLLRPWRDDDAAALAAINCDAETMRYFAGPMTRAGSDEHLARMMAHQAAHGFGMWAVAADGQVVGVVGLQHVPDYRAPEPPPLVEIGWRMRRAVWRQGYAHEAARACIGYARDVLRLPAIVALTARINAPSRALMEKLGMTYDPAADFDHHRLPPGHALHRHVLYRLRFAPVSPD